MSACPYCGWPDDQPALTLSQHPTGDGMTAWTRCACGSLQMRQITAGTVRITVRGRPADTPPGRSAPPLDPPAARQRPAWRRKLRPVASRREREGCAGPPG